ncbi:large conductance mechanosensitive channel protein MscL [Ectobacillus ponti]|uniref:Large-conductance mechanosensitive channel n=1 Tax=Ectobacillus ponti TaxID=2961894 RepID=A0AA41XAQ5_9BACI|nr:large conductance mechanosensitive channel protein MscL [Ectobacillus ponti]MCP8968581.1 large conductance mechanosensitive channel protein MscL [Ectobacillus ponti]
MWNDFKKFALKGNVLDLAVGVVIGAAFGKIVTSLVQDVIMPLVGMLLGGVNFSGLKLTFGSAVIKYGSFLQSVVDFFIIAFSIFLFIRLISRLKKKEEVKQEAAKPTQEQLLAEIRDLLKAAAKEH